MKSFGEVCRQRAEGRGQEGAKEEGGKVCRSVWLNAQKIRKEEGVIGKAGQI
jgi:hypothetical protein